MQYAGLKNGWYEIIIPIEIDHLTSYSRTGEATPLDQKYVDWLKANAPDSKVRKGGHFYEKDTTTIKFTNQKKAMFFKLVWGGAQ